MAPRHDPPEPIRKTLPHLELNPSQDKERHLEAKQHHAQDHTHPDLPHHPQAKPVLPRHTTHTHPHGDELPTHTNPPGPIKPAKKITKTGRI